MFQVDVANLRIYDVLVLLRLDSSWVFCVGSLLNWLHHHRCCYQAAYFDIKDRLETEGPALTSYIKPSVQTQAI